MEVLTGLRNIFPGAVGLPRWPQCNFLGILRHLQIGGPGRGPNEPHEHALPHAPPAPCRASTANHAGQDDHIRTEWGPRADVEGGEGRHCCVGTQQPGPLRRRCAAVGTWGRPNRRVARYGESNRSRQSQRGESQHGLTHRDRRPIQCGQPGIGARGPSPRASLLPKQVCRRPTEVQSSG
jgi:hypothetical protein